jgi:hypothetical protein
MKILLFGATGMVGQGVIDTPEINRTAEAAKARARRDG